LRARRIMEWMHAEPGLYLSGVSFDDDMRTAFRSGNADDVVERASRAELERARAAGDVPAEVSALCWLARIAARRGDYARSAELSAEARTMARDSGDWQLEQWPLHILASMARLTGDVEGARKLFAESISLNERLGAMRVAAGERHNLGYVELHAGNIARGRELLLAARDESVRNDYTSLLPATAIAIAVVAAVDGDHERAAELLGAADLLHETAGIVPDPDDAFERQTLQDRLIGALGKDRFESEHARGFTPPQPN
jgi:ATP/maltotriose-dependent transcriptional regulator MalT